MISTESEEFVKKEMVQIMTRDFKFFEKQYSDLNLTFCEVQNSEDEKADDDESESIYIVTFHLSNNSIKTELINSLKIYQDKFYFLDETEF